MPRVRHDDVVHAQDLLFKLLNFDYRERYTAEQALNHPYFKDVRDPEAEARHVAEVFDFEGTFHFLAEQVKDFWFLRY